MTTATTQAKPDDLKMEGIVFEGKLYCLETDVRKYINRLLAENASLRELVPHQPSKPAKEIP